MPIAQRSPGQPYTRELGPPQHLLDRDHGTPEAVRHWREDVVGASRVNLVAGVWLVLSPFVLGYAAADVVWSTAAYGFAIGLLALGRLTVLKAHPAPSWVNALLGAALFVTAFAVQASTQATVNEAVAGALVMLFAIASADESEVRRARARLAGGDRAPGRGQAAAGTRPR